MKCKVSLSNNVAQVSLVWVNPDSRASVRVPLSVALLGRGEDDLEELLIYAVFEQARTWTQCVEVLKTTILEMTGNESKYIMLRAVGEDGLEVHFGVKKTSPLG